VLAWYSGVIFTSPVEVGNVCVAADEEAGIILVARNVRQKVSSIAFMGASSFRSRNCLHII
jgi:hypothetical protein